MKKNTKNIMAAVLAAVCLSGCAANSDSYSTPSTVSTTSANTSSSSSSLSEEAVSSEPAVSSDNSEIGKSETDGSEIGGFETDSSVSASAESSTASTSENEISETPETESEDDGYVSIGWLKAPKGYKPKDSASETTKDKRSEEEKLVDDLIDELGLNDGEKSDMEKLCILGKWLCDNTEYDHDFISYTGSESGAEHLIALRAGRCETYAKTACLILSGCGIDTLYCSGNFGTDHAWNAVKIDGQWTYTDFVGGPDTIILGSSRLGLPKYIVIRSYLSLHGYGYDGAKPDISEISDDLRLFDFDGNELEVHEEADGFSYVDSNGEAWRVRF